ncbi:MAG: MarR family winged helix-turn-helix transcriptional regulator [Clostridia bacterium]|nr:MarR family winged helix-turn-helix transcriptional regulator [Clostridia bacterium]
MQKLIGAEIRNLQNLISRQLDNHAASLGFNDISGPNLFILKYLLDNGDKDIFQRDIEKALSVTKSTCSKVLSTMQKKGLIARCSVEDARLNKIIVTEKGCELKTKFDNFIYGHDKSLTEGLTEDEITTFLYCIDKIKENVTKTLL